MSNTSISIVSHGHAYILENLLSSLSKSSNDLEVILTINAPSLEPLGWIESLQAMPFLKVVINEQQKGFSANHNSAAKIARGCFFCVLNPDVSVATDLGDSSTLANILNILQEYSGIPGAGLAYPTQIDANGKMLDFERSLVTPWQIALRHIFAVHNPQVKSVDWVSGACLMFQTATFKKLGGFDERYHLYCEDVDICLRAQLQGYRLVKAPCIVRHDTQRRTLQSRRHLLWHLQSLTMLWLSSVFWRYLRSKIYLLPSHKG
jgi:N-acetylglucosaminyl-diphospho-decaprenol L-rhamnosyltransferase